MSSQLVAEDVTHIEGIQLKTYILCTLGVDPLLPFEDFTSSVCCPLDGLPACRRASIVVGLPFQRPSSG